MLHETLGVFVELSWELDLLVQSHLEDLVWVLGHERGSSVKGLVDEDAKGVPVHRRVVALVLNDLGGDVLGSAAERVSSVTWQELLDEAEVSELDVSILLDQHILRLEVPVNEVLRVHVLEGQHNLPDVEPCMVNCELFELVDYADKVATFHVLDVQVNDSLVLGTTVHLDDVGVVHVVHQ